VRILAIGVLLILAIIASIVLLFSSICAASSGMSGNDRTQFFLVALVALACLIGAIKLIGKLRRSG